MNELVKAEGGSLISLLHSSEGLNLPQPFERDIFLFDTRVAGTSFITGIEDLDPYLNPGDRLQFFREPDNPHDENAIVIKNGAGVKIGYVPRADNIVFARLMDAGKLLFGKIVSKEMRGHWLDMKIKIFMHE